MRALHLPVNVASHLSATVRGLCEIGVDARGLVAFGTAEIQSHDGVDVLSRAASRRSLRWGWDMLVRSPRLMREIRDADVLHWYMSPALPGGADLKLAARLGQPGVVEFAGSDIRVPEIEAADNPYYARALDCYEYREYEDGARSRRRQCAFARAGMDGLVSCPSLLDYIDREAFPEPYLVRQRVFLDDYEAAAPDPEKRRPLVVHASSAPVVKGTGAVLEAVEQLRGRVDFEFVLLQGVPREKALATVRRADVFLDQFLLGAHGGAAVEAMALAKPVVGWIKPSMRSRYPADLPIVIASQDELVDVLGTLLGDGSRRHELGLAGRAYAEQHHDAVRLAPELRAIYAELIERSSDRAG